MADKNVASATFKYLFDQNRPYSATDIHMNLHKEFGKTAIQKALDMLVEENKVKEKLYGKQKVYVVSQDLFPKVEDAEIKKMDVRIAELTAELQRESAAAREAEGRLRSLSSSLTSEQARKALQECEAEVAEKSSRLDELRQRSGQVTTADRERAQTSHRRAHSEWRKRRRITTDIVDAILEGYPKKKKDLHEELGLETDQDVGVTMPAS